MQQLKKIQQKMFQDLLEHIQPDYLENSDRLSLYSKGYFLRILDCMKGDFKIVHWILGEDRFVESIREYIKKFPLYDYNINFLGRYYPQFLKDHSVNQPYLSDMADFEINPFYCFNHFHEKPLSLESLEGVPIEDWENAVFSFQPHLILQESSWNLQNIKDQFISKKPFSESFIVKNPSHYVFYQKDEISFIAEKQRSEFRTLQLLMTGRPLGSVIAELENDEVESSIFQWFQAWNALELITRISFEKK